MSLVSSDSSVSLLASSRRPNGSGARQVSAVTDQTARSIDALDRLLRTGTGGAPVVDTNAGLISDSDLELDFDFDGLSLTELATSIKEYQIREPTLKPQSKDECMSLVDPAP